MPCYNCKYIERNFIQDMIFSLFSTQEDKILHSIEPLMVAEKTTENKRNLKSPTFSLSRTGEDKRTQNSSELNTTISRSHQKTSSKISL